MGEVTHDLLEPLGSGASTIRSLTLRPPQLADLLDFGLPVTGVHLQSGGYVETPDMAVIRSYIRRLTVGQVDHVLLGQASLADALALTEIVRGFFDTAAARLARPQTPAAETAPASSSTQPTSSSSGSDGRPPISLK